MKVTGIVYARDEAQNLAKCLTAMLNQTHPIHRIIYVDDASRDNSIKVAKDLGVDVVKQPKRHALWHGNPIMSLLPNLGIRQLSKDIDYFLINGADILLTHTYLETLLAETLNQDAVLSSGIIRGEGHSRPTPKGAGRLHQLRFWQRYVKEYPRCYGWEALVIYIARAYGYRTYCTPKAQMIPLRHTKFGKPAFGEGMHALGYFPPFAVARCLRSMLLRPPNRRKSALMLMRYLLHHAEAAHEDAANWIRHKQAPILFNHAFHPIEALPPLEWLKTKKQHALAQ